MTTAHSDVSDIRDAPAYTVLAAARCLAMSQSTLRYWVHGRRSLGGGNLISFNNLVEAHVLRALRTRDGIRIAAVRNAIDYAEEYLGIERLLLSSEFRTSGQDIFFDRLSELTPLSRSGQLTMRQMVQMHLRRVDRDDDALPCRLYPLRPAWSEEKKPIVIDPRVSFGRPTVAGSGVSTAALVDRYDAGESFEALAHDYRLEIGQIEDAVFYERAT